MFRNILWCYVFLLTLLDLSVDTKLTAQGESHGVSLHDSLVEGITFQEWDAEEGADGEQPQGVAAWPRALRFGRVALGATHAHAVTLTNRANTTLHLASVAGTTPDFHASFFDSKKLPPQGNATFHVVYLGRHEGPVAAHLYIHTSLGVHKYPVSATGVASPFGVWPLVGLRVPLNATLEPELTLYNPMGTTIQVSEVYSTGSWLALRLPGGGERAPRGAWAVPPRATRALVRLRVAPADLPAHQPLTAYVRVKANIPGGGLVVGVEARVVPPGEYARPPHVRLAARGHRDAAHTVELELANSADATVPLEGAVSGAGCWRAAPPPEPCAAPAAPAAARANGGAAPGASLRLLRAALAPHQGFAKAARLTLNFAELWAGAGGATLANGAGGAHNATGDDEAWCAGCVRLGRAAVPYSVRVLRGTLRFSPPSLDIVTSGGHAWRERELRAHNDFTRPIILRGVDLPEDVAPYFHLVSHTPLTLAPRAAAGVAHVRMRAPSPPADLALDSALTVHTDQAHYTVPLRIYSGKILFEWEWANASDALLELGAVGTSATRRVGVRLRNPAPVPLCVAALAARLPGAAATFARAQPAPECIPGGAWAQAWLTVVAPAREGALRGELQLNTSAPHAASTRVALAMRVRAGSVRLLPLRVPPAAPYAGSWAELQADSSMAARMRVTRLALAPARRDPALSFQWEGAGYGEVRQGRTRVARVRHAPEKRCEPNCYCGLSLDTEEGAAWLRRGAALDAATLREDLALLRARLQLFDEQRAQLDTNFALHMHTTEVVQTVAAGSLSLWWPRLVAAGAGRAPLAAVRRAVTLRVALRSAAHAPLLLHAWLADAPTHHDLPARAGGDSSLCAGRACAWAGDAFRLAGWRVTRGAATPWPHAAPNASAAALPPLLLAPRAELELSLQFAPGDVGAYTTYLYLRNNLTILEGVQLFGEGEQPSFELAGRRPPAAEPFLFEVKECSWGADADGADGAEGGERAVWRRVVARNPGRVPASLSRWRVAGAACAARGFAVRPCAPLLLPPNASAALRLAFAPDYTLARQAAPLQLHSDTGPVEFLLVATIPAKVLAQCASAAPRPPWDAALRSGGAALAFLALAALLAAAALDAERLLRRARAARAASQPRAPLDLRALAAPAPPAPPPPRAPPRRKRAARRPLPALDPRAERRAFERWRAEVLRRDDDDSSRSSDDDDEPTPPPPPADDSPPPPAADEDASTGSDESLPADDSPYGGDVEGDAHDEPAATEDDAPPEEPAEEPRAATPPPDAARPLRARRDADAPRRTERVRHDSERRAAPGRHHARKERASKRRVPPTPPPRSPAPACCAAGGAAGASAGAGEAGEARGAVRWGTPWSSVVVGRAALAPIGSDVRRREPERAPDHSLFYFNGAADAWRPARQPPPPAAPPAPPAPPHRPSPAYLANTRDYLEEARSLGAPTVPFGGAAASVWGAWGAWPAAPVRPPPGFAPPAPAAPEPRTYDPFRSLASIWAPAPSDWRAAPAPPAPPAPPASNDDEHRD